ncbi:MAG: hypothetical protein WC326_02930 [Candidatus Delongbacteria bacterium]
MKHMRSFFPLSLLGVLLAGSLFTGCFESDDDDDGGGNPALTGVWRHNVVENNQTIEQETVELVSDGNMINVLADYTLEQCLSFEGTWTADEDSIRTTVETPLGPYSTSVAFELSGNTLTIHDEDGETMVYSRLTTMVDCSDYEFGSSGQWTGSFGALVNGASMDFGNNVYVEFEDGMLGFGGLFGTANMAFVLDGQAVGTYTEENAAATYVPNVADYMNAFVSSELTLQLTTSTATHIAGTFSYQAANISAPAETVTVTGQFDLTLE